MTKDIIKKILGKKLVFFISRYRGISRKNILKFLHKLVCFSKSNLFGFRCKEINYLDQLNSVENFKEKDSGIISHPFYFKENEKEFLANRSAIEIPPIKLYDLKDVIFTPESSNILSEDKLIIERLPHIHISISDYATGFLKRHDNDTGLIWLGKNLINLDIEGAYYLGGNGSWNYFHWMTEILPKLEFIVTPEGFARCKHIIVSSKVRGIDSFQRTLTQALKGYDFVVHYIEPSNNYRIPSLLLVSKPSDILFNSKGVLSRVDFSFYRKGSLDYVKSLVSRICDLEVNAFEGYGRVFLARREGSARNYNQLEVKQLLENQYKFKSVYLEDYKIEDQVKIFSNAKIIAGPSGAAWTNIIFCNPEVLLISWLPTNVKTFSGYSTLAANYDLKMVFVEAEPQTHDQLHTGYKLSCEELTKCIVTHII
ncbi:MAG: glycosyltransferase family 61 protein [Methyloprofundus sp.]|nr:glycosyltransferase family 61 protein [Methyloprofundus sp.]